jgi:carbamoyl-phosphate synthase small subunit
MCGRRESVRTCPTKSSGSKTLPARFHVVAYDFGIKQNILRKLRGEGCKVTVVPCADHGRRRAGTQARRGLPVERPGDPEPCTYAVDNIRRLMGRQPIFGICLGHQIAGIALGGKDLQAESSATTAAIIR